MAFFCFFQIQNACLPGASVRRSKGERRNTEFLAFRQNSVNHSSDINKEHRLTAFFTISLFLFARRVVVMCVHRFERLEKPDVGQ